jgi:hypothetical protein
VWNAATDASVTGSNRSRSYWHSTDAVVPASAAAMPSSNCGSCSLPVTGRSAQLMSTAIRSPGNPSSLEDVSCRVSHLIAASALNTCPSSRRPSHPAAVICPASIAGATLIPRRDSSLTACPGPASLSHITFRPASSPSRTNAAVRSNSSSASPNVRHA